ncbi:hypothetical protein [Tenuibacillus multivorans]|nr:hypothetical protein [Tenuibacillus multivorans]
MKYWKGTTIPAAMREVQSAYETYHMIDFIESSEEVQYVEGEPPSS